MPTLVPGGAHPGRRGYTRLVATKTLEREVCLMRFRKLFPALTVALAIGLAACEPEAEEGETELTPADTEMMAPPPAPETMPMDTPMMGDTI